MNALKNDNYMKVERDRLKRDRGSIRSTIYTNIKDRVNFIIKDLDGLGFTELQIRGVMSNFLKHGLVKSTGKRDGQWCIYSVTGTGSKSK